MSSEFQKVLTPDLTHDALDLVGALLRGDDVEERRRAFIAKYPDFEPLVPPRPKYHAQIMVQGSEMRDVMIGINEIRHVINEGHHRSIGGSYILRIIVDDSMTPEKWTEARDAYLKKCDEAKQ